MARLSGLSGEVVANPASIADGDEVAVSVSVPGAKMGDFCFASWSADLQDLQLTASVTSNDTVEGVLSNSTGTAVDLASGTLRVAVVPYSMLTGD